MPRLLALFIVLLLCSAGAADARTKRKPCPRGAEEQSSTARVYVTSDDDGYNQLLVCVKMTRKTTVLAGWYAQGSVADDPSPQWWLTGRYLAINRAVCSPDPFDDEPCTGTLKVISLRSGRTRSTVPTGAYIRDLVLTAAGSVGMIHRTDLIIANGEDVRTLDTTAEPESLAYAPLASNETCATPGDCRYTFGRLYWTSQGQPRSAELN